MNEQRTNRLEANDANLELTAMAAVDQWRNVAAGQVIGCVQRFI